eukprot:1128333-Rhodomonas_salina.1
MGADVFSTPTHPPRVREKTQPQRVTTTVRDSQLIRDQGTARLEVSVRGISANQLMICCCIDALRAEDSARDEEYYTQ